MVYLAMFLKSAAWAFAFWIGIRRSLKGMLASCAAITLFLTATDELTVAFGMALQSLMVTLLLYGLMSLMLLSIAWKLRNPAVSMACNVMGTLGALAVVNFIMLFITDSFT